MEKLEEARISPTTSGHQGGAAPRTCVHTVAGGGTRGAASVLVGLHEGVEEREQDAAGVGRHVTGTETDVGARGGPGDAQCRSGDQER